MVNTPDSGSRGPSGSRSGYGHCVVFLGMPARYMYFTLNVPLFTPGYSKGYWETVRESDSMLGGGGG